MNGMANIRRNILKVLASTIFFGSMLNVFAQSGGAVDLNASLDKLRTDIEKADKAARRADAMLRQYEHDIVYTNKEVSKLYADIKKLEKEMVTKRKALQEMMNSTPESHEKNKTYIEAYGKLDSLRRDEQVLLKKIADGGIKEKGKGK